MIKYVTSALFVFLCWQFYGLIGSGNRSTVGVFYPSDEQLAGLIWGNWGSRPYEYKWVSEVVDINNKRVIDLGVGLPSQYNWYRYAVNQLHPSFYVGIDVDDRIINEVTRAASYEIRHMGMHDLEFDDQEFDVALCISTFEHIPYDVFIKSISEAHRVLKDNGLLVITLDERWDQNLSTTYDNNWNHLEQSLEKKGFYGRGMNSFGLPEFLSLISDYFILYEDDALVDLNNQTIISKSNPSYIYYHRNNADDAILHSDPVFNSCVSFAVLKKIPFTNPGNDR